MLKLKPTLKMKTKKYLRIDDDNFFITLKESVFKKKEKYHA